MGTYDVCILGGGASGLAAAASLDNRIKACLLEKNKILGRKLLATGGGRCNVTNRACGNKEMTLDFFKTMGIELHEDDEGRYYPYSNQASDVVKALSDRVMCSGVDVITEFNACSVALLQNGRFEISDGNKAIVADKMILATGGKAAPAMGTTGDGYIFARKLGHNIERVYPILTGIECGDFKDIKGTRARGCVSLLKDEKIIASEKGEIQFTDDGISGICVMNMTLHIKAEEGERLDEAVKRYKMELDLAPDFTHEEVIKRSSTFGILSAKLSQRVGPGQIKCWRLPVKGVKGWKNAQCTAGGVALSEIDQSTMESKLVKGLYITGEVMDFQGKCGGFNLQNAWESGLKASSHINKIYKLNLNGSK